MKRVKYIMIVLLSVIFTGCSNLNIEQQEEMSEDNITEPVLIILK